MYKIKCRKLFKKEGVEKAAFVANHPSSTAHAVEYTTDEDQAHVFTDLGICQNIRDDVLEVADNVTILRI